MKCAETDLKPTKQVTYRSPVKSFGLVCEYECVMQSAGWYIYLSITALKTKEQLIFMYAHSMHVFTICNR